MSEVITRYVDVLFDGTYKKLVEGVYQYDHGLKLRVRGVPTNVEWQMQWGYRGAADSVTAIASVVDDAVVGDIPDALLMQQREAICYLYYEDTNYGITVYEIYLPLMPRLKPATGTYTPEQIEAYDQLVAELQELISNVESLNPVEETTIAPLYENLTFPVSAGQYCWYSNTLYKANQDIQTSETWTAAHWDTAVVGADIADADVRISLLESVVVNGQGLTPAQLAEIAGSGHADNYFSPGDIITIPWTDRSGDTDVEYQIPFVIVDIADAYDSNNVKHEKAIWLQALRAIPQLMVFHAADRTEVDLSTETTAVSGWAYVGLSGSAFTALNLSAGDPIPTTYDKVYKTTYTGIALAAVQNGVARWKDSDIRQWLNSTAAKNAGWWTSQYDGATPPAAEYTNLPGVLGGFSAEWQAVFKAPKVTVSLSLDGGTTIINDYTYDKVFLPSKANVYATASTGAEDERYWAYWVSEVGGSSPNANSSPARVLTALDGSTAVAWCLRKNRNATNMGEASEIKTNGAISYYYARLSRRAAPCLCLY